MSFIKSGLGWIKDKISRPNVTRSTVLHYTVLYLILLLAFLYRVYPYFKYEHILKAYDPYFQLRMAEYINENGFGSFFDWHDERTWFPAGTEWGKAAYPGTPLVAVAIYKILNWVGFSISLYTVCYFFPAIFGTLTVYMIYKLGTELANEKVGLIAAFFLSFNPAYAQRSVVGFFDNEALGIFLIITSFYFFIKSLKTGSVTNGILAGLFLGFLAASWGAFRFALDMIAIYAFILLLQKRYSNRLLISYSLTVSTALLMTTIVPRTGMSIVTGVEGIFPLAVMGLLIFYGLTNYFSDLMPRTRSPFMEKLSDLWLPIIVVIIPLFLVALWAFGGITGISGKFLGVLLPTIREGTPLINSVSEHLPLSWANLYYSVEILLFLVPAGAYFLMRNPSEENIFLLVFGLTTIYFASSMVRLILIFAPAACLIAALAIDKVLTPYALALKEKLALSRRKVRISAMIGKEQAAVVYIFIGILLSLNMWHGVQAVDERLGQPEMAPTIGDTVLDDWQQTLEFMDTALNENTVVLFWWDYGHWVTALGNVRTLADGSTINSLQIGQIGRALVFNETESLKILWAFSVDYVLVNFAAAEMNAGSDLAKAIWMIRIGQQYGTMGANFEVSDYYKDGKYTEAFTDGVLYRLCMYNMDAYKEKLTNSGLFDEVPSVSSLTYFNEVFTSTNDWVRIYQVVYPVGYIP